MRSIAMSYSSGRYCPSTLARLSAFSAATSLRPSIVAFSRSDFCPSPASLVRNQFATVMNSILGMKLGISTSAVHSRWPGSML